jgi:hypothetical protein
MKPIFKLFTKKFIDEGWRSLAFAEFHDLSYEEVKGASLAGFEVGNRLGVGSEDLIN